MIKFAFLKLIYINYLQNGEEKEPVVMMGSFSIPKMEEKTGV